MDALIVVASLLFGTIALGGVIALGEWIERKADEWSKRPW